MTINLLSRYAFILHENINDITDKEIDTARDFVSDYLKRNSFLKNYDKDFDLFANKQKFKVITSYDYDSIEKLIYQVIKEINDLVNIYDWEFDIYYNSDYKNTIFLSRLNNNGDCEKIDLTYNINDKTFCSVDKPITQEMNKLGSINYNSYSLYELYNVRI